MKIEKDITALIVKLGSPEMQQFMIDLELRRHIGERCRYCNKEYKTIDDLKGKVVFAPKHAHGNLACKPCWKKYSKTDPVVRAAYAQKKIKETH